MAEYIEREATCKFCFHFGVCDILDPLHGGVQCDKFVPTADVVEVVHGEWTVTEDDYAICATEFTCSHCKVSLATSELTDGQFLDMMNFCPNCGAKMDGERKCEDA